MLHHGQGESRMPGQAAFVSVREGSGKLCSFCVVAYTRGSEYYRPAAAVLAEARRLAAAGVQEITLLGQNVNAYHGEAPGSVGGSSVGGSSVWGLGRRSEEHTSELQSLMRTSYAVFCLTKKRTTLLDTRHIS